MPDANANAAPADKLEFHYIKSNFFRVVHADGAYGGPTARGYLHVAFYNERRAIPQRMDMTVDQATQKVVESVAATRHGVVREVEVSVMLDQRSVAELIVWLQNQLKHLGEVNTAISEMEPPK